MPIYTYECPEHGEFDEIMCIAELTEMHPCPVCNGNSKKVIVNGHGGIQRNDTTWVREATKMFDMDGHRPMNTIDDLRKFYQENPTIRPQESHPALPSSLGDYSRPPDEVEVKRQRKKQAMEWLRKDESLTVNSQTRV
jgi:putative FmdB family regulatory protein